MKKTLFQNLADQAGVSSADPQGNELAKIVRKLCEYIENREQSKPHFKKRAKPQDRLTMSELRDRARKT